MQVIAGSVRSGKTTQLILHSILNKIPILVQNNREKEHLILTAKQFVRDKINLPNHNKISFLELFKEVFIEPIVFNFREGIPLQHKGIDRVLIDNADTVFQKIIGAKIEVFTLGDPNYQLYTLSSLNNPSINYDKTPLDLRLENFDHKYLAKQNKLFQERFFTLENEVLIKNAMFEELQAKLEEKSINSIQKNKQIRDLEKENYFLQSDLKLKEKELEELKKKYKNLKGFKGKRGHKKK